MPAPCRQGDGNEQTRGMTLMSLAAIMAIGLAAGRHASCCPQHCAVGKLQLRALGTTRSEGEGQSSDFVHLSLLLAPDSAQGPLLAPTTPRFSDAFPTPQLLHWVRRFPVLLASPCSPASSQCCNNTTFYCVLLMTHLQTLPLSH